MLSTIPPEYYDPEAEKGKTDPMNVGAFDPESLAREIDDGDYDLSPEHKRMLRHYRKGDETDGNGDGDILGEDVGHLNTAYADMTEARGEQQPATRRNTTVRSGGDFQAMATVTNQRLKDALGSDIASQLPEAPANQTSEQVSKERFDELALELIALSGDELEERLEELKAEMSEQDWDELLMRKDRKEVTLNSQKDVTSLLDYEDEEGWEEIPESFDDLDEFDEDEEVIEEKKHHLRIVTDESEEDEE